STCFPYTTLFRSGHHHFVGGYGRQILDGEPYRSAGGQPYGEQDDDSYDDAQQVYPQVAVVQRAGIADGYLAGEPCQLADDVFGRQGVVTFNAGQACRRGPP